MVANVRKHEGPLLKINQPQAVSFHCPQHETPCMQSPHPPEEAERKTTIPSNLLKVAIASAVPGAALVKKSRTAKIAESDPRCTATAHNGRVSAIAATTDAIGTVVIKPSSGRSAVDRTLRLGSNEPPKQSPRNDHRSRPTNKGNSDSSADTIADSGTRSERTARGVQNTSMPLRSVRPGFNISSPEARTELRSVCSSRSGDFCAVSSSSYSKFRMPDGLDTRTSEDSVRTSERVVYEPAPSLRVRDGSTQEQQDGRDPASRARSSRPRASRTPSPNLGLDLASARPLPASYGRHTAVLEAGRDGALRSALAEFYELEEHVSLVRARRAARRHAQLQALSYACPITTPAASPALPDMNWHPSQAPRTSWYHSGQCSPANSSNQMAGDSDTPRSPRLAAAESPQTDTRVRTPTLAPVPSSAVVGGKRTLVDLYQAEAAHLAAQVAALTGMPAGVRQASPRLLFSGLSQAVSLPLVLSPAASPPPAGIMDERVVNGIHAAATLLALLQAPYARSK